MRPGFPPARLHTSPITDQNGWSSTSSVSLATGPPNRPVHRKSGQTRIGTPACFAMGRERLPRIRVLQVQRDQRRPLGRGSVQPRENGHRPALAPRALAECWAASVTSGRTPPPAGDQFDRLPGVPVVPVVGVQLANEVRHRWPRRG